METLHDSGMHVRIHGKYAEQLGYGHLVGAMGIIDDVMSTLCGVVILEGPAGCTFIKEDIHIEDCELLTKEEGPAFSALININTGHIFYSRDKNLLQFAHGCMHQTSVRYVHGVTGVDEIHEFCDTYLEPTYHRLRNNNADFDWIIHDLDNMDDPESSKFKRIYDEQVARQAAERAIQAPSVQKTAQLLEEFKKQMNFPQVAKNYPHKE